MKKPVPGGPYRRGREQTSRVATPIGRLDKHSPQTPYCFELVLRRTHSLPLSRADPSWPTLVQPAALGRIHSSLLTGSHLCFSNARYPFGASDQDVSWHSRLSEEKELSYYSPSLRFLHSIQAAMPCQANLAKNISLCSQAKPGAIPWTAPGLMVHTSSTSPSCELLSLSALGKENCPFPIDFGLDLIYYVLVLRAEQVTESILPLEELAHRLLFLGPVGELVLAIDHFV